MGTTLTGTTPQDTYDSLIKVTDNGPLSGSLKKLTDGLGNDSALSLSTGAASITGTLAVTTGTNLATSSGSVGIGLSSPTAKLEIQDGPAGAAVKVSNSGGGSAQLAISSNATSVATLSFSNSLSLTGGNVGIGTSSPNYSLQVNSSTTTTRLQITNSTTGTSSANGLQFIQDGNDTTISLKPSGFMSFETANNERLRITSAGNVGIGTTEITTSTYAGKLSVYTAGGGNIAVGGATNTNNAIVSRIISANTNNGNSGNESSNEFRGVTSIESAIVTTDSNAGADSGGYIMFKTKPEGGALTEVARFLATGGLTFNGDTAAANALDDYEEGTWTPAVAFGGASVGVTYALQQGSYTKIGRQVTVNAYFILSSKGSSSGAATITGLPFTIPNSNANYSSAAVRMREITFGGQFQWIGNIGTTTVGLRQTTEGGTEAVIGDSNFANDSEAIFTFTYFV